MQKFGKSMKDIIELKSDFLKQNDELLLERKAVADLYIKQPLKKNCLICRTTLLNHNDFNSQGIDYCVCENCGHVNGIYVEDDSFANNLYINQNYGKEYAANKTEYLEKIRRIYQPKLNFLKESLGAEKVNESNILDIGAGSGYFVATGKNENIKIKGVEISEQQAKFANEMIGEKSVCVIKSAELKGYIENTKANIITAFGVFEHLTNLHEICGAINNNKSIKYIYCSIPMFSVSVMLEIMHQECFNRQLGGGHTHLFTNKSVEYLCNLYGWNIIHSWRFGSDIMDFLRMLKIKIGENKALNRFVNDNLFKVADEVQLVLDKAEISSEIHLILQKSSF